MPKFRKKPVVVDAQQWWPPGDLRHDPSMLIHRKGNQVDPPDYRQSGDLWQFSTIRGMGDDVFMIRTGGSNSDVQVHPGDWIITGIKGEKYPCKPDIFAATYEPVEDDAISPVENGRLDAEGRRIDNSSDGPAGAGK